MKFQEFILKEISESDILREIKSFKSKSSSGFDNIPNKPFSCTICDFEHEDISEVNNHIETLHAIKYRIDLITARQIRADNERERSQIIRLLGRSDKPAIPLYIPFNYWD